MPALPPNSPVSAPSLSIGTLVAGRYRVDTLLGSGGTGRVYRAQHLQTGQSVAIKALHRDMTTDAVRRFEQEAIASARIHHPNVVNAIEFGTLSDGSSFLVLDYVEGETLAQALGRDGTLPVGQALHITREVLLALGAVHEAGVVHRDLKPENVMLSARSAVSSDALRVQAVRVLDFGIAKIDAGKICGGACTAEKEQETAQQDEGLGTPDYMSPEQASGGATDHRADLYSVGVMAYRMLVGTTPFAGDNPLVVLTRQLVLPAPPLPRQFRDELRALVAKLLEKDPCDRFQSAQEVLAPVEQLLERY